MNVEIVMPIGRGGGIANLEGGEGEGEGFAAALDDGAVTAAPALDMEAVEASPQVTSLSDGWVIGS